MMFNSIFKSNNTPAAPKARAHVHDWKLVACNDEYRTKSSTGGAAHHWKQRFYKCSCGERKHQDDRREYDRHEGIDQARQNWIDAGVIPGKSYFPDESKGFYKPTDAEVKELTPLTKYQNTLDDIQEALMLVTRNIDLEEKYPELKESYRKHMELYRELAIAEKLYNTGKS
jgi:hypothetical protein